MPFRDEEKRREYNRAYYKRREARNGTILNKYKAFCGCKCCGEKDVRCLDFHHKNPENKAFRVSEISRNWELVKQEVRKCEVLCANCHRKEHR